MGLHEQFGTLKICSSPFNPKVKMIDTIDANQMIAFSLSDSLFLYELMATKAMLLLVWGFKFEKRRSPM